MTPSPSPSGPPALPTLEPEVHRTTLRHPIYVFQQLPAIGSFFPFILEMDELFWCSPGGVPSKVASEDPRKAGLAGPFETYELALATLVLLTGG